MIVQIPTERTFDRAYPRDSGDLAPDLHSVPGTSFGQCVSKREVSMRLQWVRILREHLKTVRRFTKRGGLKKIAAGLVIATAVSACDSWGPHDSVTSPSNDPALMASISVPTISANGQTTPSVRFIPFRCSDGTQFTGPLDIAMTAGQNVDLHEVSIRLGGSGIPATGGLSGAPQTNSFDSDDLASAFGSTQIPGGTVKTFRFRTDLSCGRRAEFVAVDIQFTEASGRRNSITVTAPFGSAIDLGL
jgi:hypothetical protein